MAIDYAHRFKYWNDTLISGELPKTMANRYVIFDADQGGLNNIRLAFEYVVVITALTGRTLVMPPKSPWYLINYGPMPEDLKGGTTQFSNIYNIEALRQALPVISTGEFIKQASEHLNIPQIFQDEQDTIDREPRDLQAWKNWLLENAEIPKWNPHDTVICLPSIDQAKTGPHFSESYLANRRPVEFSVWMKAAPTLYFPSTDNLRSLGPVATMLASSDDHIPTIGRRLIKHNVRYRDEIFLLADKLIKALKLSEYDALQVRRNDFQYEQTRTSTDNICNNISALFDQNLPIYLASDETDKQIIEELAQGLGAPKIYSWQDIENMINFKIPYAWIGPIEQLICTAARRFVGNDLSTFTSYINRLRGYTLAEDQNSYFHNEHYTQVPDKQGMKAYTGRSYLREHPLFWLAC
jgi:hypothetical protein